MDILTTLRQYRIGPFTLFDSALAYLGVFLLAPLFTKLFQKIHLSITRIQWMWLTLPIAVLTHILIKQNTPLTKMILDLHGNYLAKGIVLFMLFMGLKDTKRMRGKN